MTFSFLGQFQIFGDEAEVKQHKIVLRRGKKNKKKDYPRWPPLQRYSVRLHYEVLFVVKDNHRILDHITKLLGETDFQYFLAKVSSKIIGTRGKDAAGDSYKGGGWGEMVCVLD